MTTRRARAPTAGKTKPLGGRKTEGMGVERQTKVGTHDPLGGPKTEGMGVERQTKVGTHDPSGHGAEAARLLYAVQQPDTALRINCRKLAAQAFGRHEFECMHRILPGVY
jgi:hypothetical protein